MANLLIPTPLAAHFAGPYQTTCWLWALKLSDGTWEGYSSLESNVAGVAYSSTVNEDFEYLGSPWNISDVPALTYYSMGGVAMTSQPTRLNLGEDGIDATTLALDRAKLLAGGYNNAEFEAFRVNYADLTMGRHVRVSGLIGNRRVGMSVVTFQLMPWPAQADASFGRVVSPLCDVGIFPNERFGTGRCRNQTLNDGPARDAWSVAATVVSVTDSHTLRVSFGATSVATSALNSQFANRLAEGDVLFTSGAANNVGQSVKTSTTVTGDAGGPATVDLVLHQQLSAVPAAGDTLTLTAGCRKTSEDCGFFSNVVNFQGFPQVPGREGVLRQYGT